MSNTVRATAPCRADLAGGTLDIWPLGLLHRNALTVNIAIPVRVTLEVSDGGPERGRSTQGIRGSVAVAGAIRIED